VDRSSGSPTREESSGKGKGKDLEEYEDQILLPGDFIGYSSRGEPLFYQDAMPRREQDPMSGEILRYIDGEPEYVP